MFKAIIVGNLGGDAELHSENGNDYVTFRVAHTERRGQGEQQTESTTWISCLMNGKNENFLPYLKKGTTVAVMGDLSLRTYHSEAQHRLVAGANLFVRSCDLVGSRPADVPSRLYDKDGVEHKVFQFFNVQDAKDTQLFSRSGDTFLADNNGWVTRQQTAQQPQEPGNSDNAEQNEANTQNNGYDGF